MKGRWKLTTKGKVTLMVHSNNLRDCSRAKLALFPEIVVHNPKGPDIVSGVILPSETMSHIQRGWNTIVPWRSSDFGIKKSEDHADFQIVSFDDLIPGRVEIWDDDGSINKYTNPSQSISSHRCAMTGHYPTYHCLLDNSDRDSLSLHRVGLSYYKNKSKQQQSHIKDFWSRVATLERS